MERAVSFGLAGLSVTDHDSLDGLPRAAAAAEAAGIRFVPGVELTAEHEGAEVHVLGYFVEARGPILEETARLRALRTGRLETMLARLDEMGVHVPKEAVLRVAGDAAPSRPHVAAAMRQLGLVDGIGAAFKRYIGDAAPGYVPKTRLSLARAVELVRDAGGAPVLAHPALSRVEFLVPVAASLGFVGVEAYHPEQRGAYSRITAEAQRAGLIVTGGSDCHGDYKERAFLGAATAPLSVVEELREAAGSAGS